MTRFEVVANIAAPPQRVFDVSLEVEVHTASMSGSAERAVDGVTSGRLRPGDTVTWQATHFGLRWRMTSRISAFDPPRFFVDEQVRGPFKRWHHAHHFDPDGHGGTVMRDVIDFAAPLGPLGIAAERLVLNRYMPRLINLRNEHVKAIAER
ncbi:ligand-binding SRPBCC domain-containing protein [Saccharothrix ecbatanensis]|uniref:Ligand-binding SRPBCC domain-containing protein n=1 Tax=Saccharothrix ecbatanensis TaxID=1105145 RepID=A0A7W9HPL4_9PSEU|nr:SRPBCC family protein [Saccharothrix ecbatanensis]MBB5805733.1 ligand-binding SRPBCC domain-containing protein [Saccharothrix ecbatanensis]